MAISKLNSTDELAGGDQFAIGSTSSGDDRRAALSLLQEYMQNNLTFPEATGVQQFTTQYSSPSATGFNIAITDDSNNTHLILTPTAGYASGTITLPAVANAIDKQEVLVNCTQQVNSLTVDGNGATAVTGEPTSLGADDFFRMKYDLANSVWYRVG